MSRTDKIAVVESFLDCLVSKDLARLPVEPDLTVESPFIAKVGGGAAMKYVKRVADSVTAIRVRQHVVEGDFVATLFDEDTAHGTVAVFSLFQVVSDRIKDVSVFYDPRKLSPRT
jgi:hypothetical protein